MNRFYFTFTDQLWLVYVDHNCLTDEVFVLPEGMSRFIPTTNSSPSFTSDDIVRSTVEDTLPSDLIFNTAKCVETFFNNKGE